PSAQTSGKFGSDVVEASPPVPIGCSRLIVGFFPMEEPSRCARISTEKTAWESSGLWRRLGRGRDHGFEQFAEVLQTRSRDDDGVAPAVDVFGDAQETAARILLERKD